MFSHQELLTNEEMLKGPSFFPNGSSFQSQKPKECLQLFFYVEYEASLFKKCL